MEELKYLLYRQPDTYAFDPTLWIETPCRKSGEIPKYHIRTEKDAPYSRHLRRRRSNDIMSTIMDDPYCLKTQDTLAEGLAKGSFWLDKNTGTLFDLDSLNLVSAKRIVDAVDKVHINNTYESWKDWYSRSNTDVSEHQIVRFVTYFLQFSQFLLSSDPGRIFPIYKLHRIQRWIICGFY